MSDRESLPGALAEALLELDPRLARALRSGPIRAVTFDAAGTLLRLRQPVGEVYAEIAKGYDLYLSPEALQDAFDVVFSQMPPLAFPPLPEEELEGLEREWWRQLVLMVATEAHREIDPVTPFAEAWADVFDDLFEELWESYGTAERWAVYEEVPGVVAALDDAGLALGVVSNFDSRVEGLLAELGLVEHFDALTLSSRAGAAKPNPTIFAAALSALDVEAHETVHVGDSLSHDWQGATAAGLNAIVVARSGITPARGDITAVSDLTPLPLLLGAVRP